MAALEELLYQQLTGDSRLAPMLSTFLGEPAVFEYRIPSDTDSGWSGKQYPRLDYSVERREDPERRVVGTVMVNIWNDTNDDTTIESIEAQLKTILDGSVYHPTDEPVIGFRWSQSRFFTSGRQQGNVSMSEIPPSDLLYGMTVEYDLIAFPSQTTFSPDPVAAITTWAQTAFTGIQVDPASWTPTSGEPALYWRFGPVTSNQMTSGVIWFKATLYAHVIAPTPEQRLPWIRKVTEQLMVDGWIGLDDGSGMRIERVAADSARDPLRTGQITVQASYGILVPQGTSSPLDQATVSGAVEGKVT